MPPKKKQGSAARGSCSICCQVVSDKDEALFCAGKCQQWLHRYCGSVPEQQYKAISNSKCSFLCPCCDREHQQEEIIELRSTVEAMKMEMAQLKESLATLSAVHTETAHVSSKLSYASMAKRSDKGKFGHGRRSRGRQLCLEDKSNNCATKRPESSAGSTVTSATKPNEPAAAAGKWHKIQVMGARRIWGTLNECTVNSVKNVISRICI